ncbi:four-carbon acid sugar kinase family protein [Arthrobacter ramosus]|uniref:Four-carbon acid sugar kinase family protein n=1 Tax=Arthrobacter ramosus TaxID=1672 RepID=A0ABV5XUP9_ARTRM|nr:four-carbon acid sugar kinase family protein [Arthrobacter ramosus]
MNTSEPQTQSYCRESTRILPNLSKEGGIVDCSQTDLQEPAVRFGSCDLWTIVADDLSGATDAAAPFSRFAKTRIIRDTVVHRSTMDVVSLNTESRQLRPSAAALVVETLVGSLIKQGRQKIFKKVDSRLRGNVGDEVAGALRALGRKGLPAFAVVAPALPAAARITVDGAVLIDGLSAKGETNSIDVVEALRQGGLRAAVIKRSEYADAQTLTDRIRGVFLAECDAAVVDCTTDDDLVTVATAHRLLEFQSLLVGSAGLAAGVVNSLPDAVRGIAPSRCSAGSAHPYQSGSHRWPANNHQHLQQIEQPGSLTRGDR